MTNRMTAITFEKVIDLAVVIAGILIAISMNTCVENRAFKKDWLEHKVLFVKSIEQTKIEYVKNLSKLKKQIELGDKAMLDAEAPGKLNKENLNKFSSTLGSLYVSAAINEGLYKSFLTSKNPYFLNNFDLMVAFEEFFAFRNSAEAVADAYINLVLPELFGFHRKTMADGFFETKIGKKELKFFISFQKGFLGGIVSQYEEQIEKSDKLLKILKSTD